MTDVLRVAPRAERAAAKRVRSPRHGRCATLLAALAWALACGAEPPPLPDLLLITAAPLRADQLSCYGGPDDAGVAICGLASHGTRFVWAFTTATQGGPAAASLLTSLLPSDHGLDDRPASFLRSDVTTLPERLREAGYHTAAFVSSPELLRARNLDQGFELYDDRLHRADGAAPARTAALTVDAALAWIDGVEGRWAVWTHFGDLHGPYPPPAVPNYEAYRVRETARLARIDAAVDRLLRHLETRERVADVIFAGLHGESIGEEGQWYEHGHSLGLEQLRVPLIWSRTDGRAPRVLPNPVSTLDVLPTWVRLVSLPAPEGSEGVALPRPSDPPAAPGTRAIDAEHAVQRAVVMGRFFYLRGPHARVGGRLAELPEDGSLPELGPVDGPGRRTRMEMMERHLAERMGPPTAPRPAADAADAAEGMAVP
jgi:arylsulfatase A-like enzyme